MLADNGEEEGVVHIRGTIAFGAMNLTAKLSSIPSTIQLCSNFRCPNATNQSIRVVIWCFVLNPCRRSPYSKLLLVYGEEARDLGADHDEDGGRPPLVQGFGVLVSGVG